MSLSAVSIAQAVLQLEQALDIGHEDWHVGDMHLWPLYRMEIYRLLFAPGATRSTVHALPRLGPVWRRQIARPTEAARAHSVWLVSDGISFSRLGRRDIERFCTPLYETCRALGRDAVLIDRFSAAPRACDEPYRWCAPQTQRAKVICSLFARAAPDQRHERLVRQIEGTAERLGLTMPALNPRRFDAMSRTVLRLAGSIERRMRDEGVKFVFVVGYYDVGGYAHVLAAARAGIVSIDVQHGVAGELHMGYADWRVHPPSGLRLLPQLFWTWTAADAAVVEHWAALQSSRRRTVVGGHPFLQAWRSGQIGLDSEMALRLERLRQRAAGKPAVLVTLQPNVTGDAALKPLLGAFARRPDVCWWLRLHPMSLADRPEFERLLRRHEVACWDIETATELPLPALIAASTVHATHSSSVVLEAELVGVPSIVWSDYGAELFAEAIGHGTAHVAHDGDRFVELLQGLKPRFREASASDQPMTAALHSIFEYAA